MTIQKLIHLIYRSPGRFQHKVRCRAKVDDDCVSRFHLGIHFKSKFAIWGLKFQETRAWLDCHFDFSQGSESFDPHLSSLWGAKRVRYIGTLCLSFASRWPQLRQRASTCFKSMYAREGALHRVSKFKVVVLWPAWLSNLHLGPYGFENKANIADFAQNCLGLVASNLSR